MTLMPLVVWPTDNLESLFAEELKRRGLDSMDGGESSRDEAGQWRGVRAVVRNSSLFCAVGIRLQVRMSCTSRGGLLRNKQPFTLTYNMLCMQVHPA